MLGKPEAGNLLANLKADLSFWCSMQPEVCTSGCYNIRSCKRKRERCAVLKENEKAYKVLKEKIPKTLSSPTPSYLRKVVAGTVTIKKLTTPFKDLLKYLVDYRKNPCKDE